MIPVQKTNHLVEGLSWLLQQYQGRPVITAFLTSYLQRAQELENVQFEILNERNLAGEGAQLDILGSLVGESRNGRTDVFYQPAIRIKILVNRSDGSATALENILIAIAAQAGISADNAKNYIQFTEYQPARFRVVSLLPAAYNVALITAMRKAKSAGVAFDFQGNGSVPPGTSGNYITYDDATTSTGQGRGFAHTTGPVDNMATHVESY